jgi:hypothetical protein
MKRNKEDDNEADNYKVVINSLRFGKSLKMKNK